MVNNEPVKPAKSRFYRSLAIKLLVICFVDLLAIRLRRDAGQLILTPEYLDLIFSPFVLAIIVALLIHTRRLLARRADWFRVTSLTMNIALGICIFDLFLAMVYYGIHVH